MQKLEKKYFYSIVGAVSVFIFAMIGLGILQPKQVNMIVDGEVIETKTSAFFVRDIIKDYVKEAVDQEYQASHKDSAYINNGDEIVVDTKKAVVMSVGGELSEVYTFSNTVEELLTEQNLHTDYIEKKEVPEARMGSYIGLEGQHAISSRYLIDDSMKQLSLRTLNKEPLHLTFEEITVIEKVVEKPVDTIYKYTRDLMIGEERVVEAGQAQIHKEIKRLIYHNGQQIEEASYIEEVQRAGAPKIIEKGINSGNSEVIGYSVWDDLAYCESGGRWDANTGNGFSGGLQWMDATWKKASSAVGYGHIPYAYLATREEQIKAAEYWLSITSWNQWPACSAKLGLR